ncbi:MAG: hypothetical protein H0U69_03210 [Trueperaceae bacterium]|nr:hypothetical protein [Trueperaceae bacterium]
MSKRAADERAGQRRDERPKLTRRDTWHLVWQTYATSLPYMLVFVIAMLAVTWFVTTVVFR